MNGDLANQLTENCTSCLENVFSIKIKHKQNIDINKEDIFFAWLGNHDEPNWKITVCTLSFPSYGYSSDKMKALNDWMIKDKQSRNRDSKKYAKGGRFSEIPQEQIEALNKMKNQSELVNKQFKEHMDTNDIIICNWDFVQEDGEWKIDGIAMRKLSECIITPFYYRWKLGLALSIVTCIDFKKVLRFDYIYWIIFIFPGVLTSIIFKCFSQYFSRLEYPSIEGLVN